MDGFGELVRLHMQRDFFALHGFRERRIVMAGQAVVVRNRLALGGEALEEKSNQGTQEFLFHAG